VNNALIWPANRSEVPPVNARKEAHRLSQTIHGPGIPRHHLRGPGQQVTVVPEFQLDASPGIHAFTTPGYPEVCPFEAQEPNYSLLIRLHTSTYAFHPRTTQSMIARHRWFHLTVAGRPVRLCAAPQIS